MGGLSDMLMTELQPRRVSSPGLAAPRLPVNRIRYPVFTPERPAPICQRHGGRNPVGPPKAAADGWRRARI